MMCSNYTENQSACHAATKTKLESNNDVQLATLTKHNLVGDLLYGTVFNYFALNDLQDQTAAQSSDIINYRLPSYGTFSTNMQTQYWYGLPRNVTFGGLSMDIDHMKQHRNSKTNNKEETIAFSQSIGARMSAMEHLVPEQMFSTETEKAQGISAVKALAIASQQGQKIWTITNDNVDLALNRINLGAEAENDIRNAVNAGKIATAHETRVNFNGWVGEGYTLIDPSTGAGAYMISGGGNGGIIPLLSGTALGAAFAAILGLFVALAGPLAVITLVLGLVAVFAVATYNVHIWSAEQGGCFWTGFGFGSAVTGVGLVVTELVALILLMNSVLISIAVRITDLVKSSISALLGSIFSIGTLTVNSTPIQNCGNL